MTVMTVYFGAVAVDEDAVVDFPEGLPGFEDLRRFVPLRHPSAEGLVFLQSLDAPGLCFVAAPVQVLRRDYCIALAPDDLETLGFAPQYRPVPGVDVNALAIVALEEGKPPSANLQSPVVIAVKSRRAVQAIRPDDRYGYSEPLVSEEPGALCS